MRTESSRTYQQVDGSFVTEYYTGSVFYQPEGSTDWQPIDTTLAAVAAGDVKARADGAPAHVSLAAADADGGFLILDGAAKTISFGLPTGVVPGAANAQPAIKENGLYAEYSNFLPGGIGLRVFPRSDGFKSFLILPSRPIVNSFTLSINAPGLTLVDEGDGSFSFRDGSGAIVGRIPRPYMVDSSQVEGFGSGLYSEAVTLSVAGILGSYLLTLTIDPSYLDSAVYPVYVDPTTTNFPTGSTTANDTFAAERYPNSNFNNYQDPGGYYEMWHGKEPGYTTYDEVFIRFNDLAETLGTIHVDQAYLAIHPWWQYYHYEWKPSWVERIDPTAAWEAGTLKWSNRPGTVESLGQFDTKEGVTFDGDPTRVTDVNGGVTGFVQRVVSGSITNNGFKLHAASLGNGGWKRFVSRNETVATSLRPKLVVKWRDDVEARRGQESFYTRVPFDLGGGWLMAVGVHNGELTLDRHLFEIPSYGPPQSLSLSYSSLNAASAYLGTGWSSNLTQRLTFDTGVVDWHRADGGLVRFTQVGGIWTPPAGHFETLTSGGGEYTVTLKDQAKFVFEGTAAGRLKRITNRFGKSLTLVWNTGSATATDASGRVMNMVIGGGLITSASDSAGRQWQFNYTSGQLTSVTDPTGKVTTLAYTGGVLTSISRTRTPASGPAETITWSVAYASGKVSGVTDAVNSSVANTFTYTGAQTTVGLLKQYSPVVRNTWTYTIDSLGRVTSALDPEGYTTSYTYDASSNLTQLVLPISLSPSTNQTINYTYDARGNELTQTTQLTATSNVVTAMSYNATNDLLTRSEADNDASLKLVTRYAYDGAGHLTSVNVNCTTSGTTPPTPASSCTGAGTQNSSTNLITSFAYTANDQLETETDPRGIVTKHVYDIPGNETQTIANYVSAQSATHERNVTTSLAYDQATTAGKAGLPTSMTDPVGHVTTYTYDALGRQTSEALPGDSSVPALTRSTTYDEFGNVLTETESWSGITPRTTTHAYNKANRETSLTDPVGVATTTSYDAAGNAISSSHAGVTTTRTFDGLGRTTAETVASATTTRQYDGQDRETRSVDPEGVTTIYVYDTGGRMVSETVDLPPAQEPDLTTSYAFDLLDRQISSTPPDAVTTTTKYDRVGRVVCERFGSGDCPDLIAPEATYGYDRVGNETSATDRGGTTTTTVYDALNRAFRIIANDVPGTPGSGEDVTTETYYDAIGNTLATKDPDGNITRRFYSVRGTLTGSIANCTNTGFDPPVDPASCAGTGTANSVYNVVTTFAFDGSGSQQATKDPMGTVTRTFYNAAGQPTKTIVNCTNDASNPSPPSGNWWNCSGSPLNDGTWNLTSTLSYNSDGNVEKETAPNGRVTKYVYDGFGRVSERIDNWVAGTPTADQNISIYFAYDDAGRQTAVRTPTANRATFSVLRSFYDDAGRLIKEIGNCTDSGDSSPGDPAWKTCQGLGTKDADTNLTTQYGYDASGNQAWVTAADPSATVGTSQAAVTTRYAYDSQNRLCGVLENATIPLASPDPCVSPGSGTATQNVWTRYSYDPVGNLTSMVDGRGNTTTYGYDALRQMTSITDATGKTTVWTYNVLGQRTGQSRRGIQPQPTLVSWSYDEAGRRATRVAGGATTSYAYDLSGNQTSASAPGSTISTTYDRLNRPLQVTVSGDSAATTTYTYSLTSPSWTDPSGAYTATLDKFDRQVALTDPIHGASQFTWTYRADSQSATMSAPNGNTTTHSYDDSGRASGSVTAAGQTQRAAYTWTRNRAGQVLTEVSTIVGDPTNGTTTYTYDPLARLTSDNRAGSTSLYGWQAVPNRSSVQVDANPTLTTTFDQANRPTVDSTSGTYTHDIEGRMTARPGQTLEWDDLGRLVRVRNGSGAVIAEYTYDALDRLLAVNHPGIEHIRFRHVGMTTQVAQIADHATGSPLRKFANDWIGTRLLDWTGVGSDQHYYGTNGHHDVTWTATETGGVSSTLRYGPWGILVASSGTYLPAFRFQGSWFDLNTQLSWVVTRWYAPDRGTFVSEDDLLGRPSSPASRHLYAYGHGDPVNHIDPSGRMPFLVIPIAWLALRVAIAVITAAPVVQKVATVGQRILPTVQAQVDHLRHIHFTHSWAHAPLGRSFFLQSVRWWDLIKWGDWGRFDSTVRYSNGNWTVINTVRFNQVIGYERVLSSSNQLLYYRATDLITYIFRNGMLYTMYPGVPRFSGVGG